MFCGFEIARILFWSWISSKCSPWINKSISFLCSSCCLLRTSKERVFFGCLIRANPRDDLILWRGWISIGNDWTLQISRLIHPTQFCVVYWTDVRCTCKQITQTNKNKVGAHTGTALLFWVSWDEAVSVCLSSVLGCTQPFVWSWCEIVGVHHPRGLNLCDLTFNAMYVHFSRWKTKHSDQDAWKGTPRSRFKSLPSSFTSRITPPSQSWNIVSPSRGAALIWFHNRKRWAGNLMLHTHTLSA